MSHLSLDMLVLECTDGKLCGPFGSEETARKADKPAGLTPSVYRWLSLLPDDEPKTEVSHA